MAFLDPPSSTCTSLSKQPSAASSATTFRLGSDDENDSLSDLDTSDEDLDLEYDQNAHNDSHLHMGLPLLPTRDVVPSANVSPNSFSSSKGVKMSLKLTPPKNTKTLQQKFSEPPSSAPPKLHRVHSTQVLEKLPKYCKQQSSPSRLDRPQKSPKSPNTRSLCGSKTNPLPTAAKGLCFEKKESKWSQSEKPVHNLRIRKHSSSQDDKCVSPRKQARLDQSTTGKDKLCTKQAQMGCHVENNLGSQQHVVHSRVRSLSVGSSSHLRHDAQSSLTEMGPRQAVTAKSPLKVETSALQSPTSAMISPIWPKSLDKDLGEGSLTALDSCHSCENTDQDRVHSEPRSSSGGTIIHGSVLAARSGLVSTGHSKPPLQENATSSRLAKSQKMSAVKGFLKLFSHGSQNKAPLTRGGLKRRASTEGAPPNPKKMKVLPKVSKLHTKVLQSTRLKRRTRGVKKRKF